MLTPPILPVTAAPTAAPHSAAPRPIAPSELPPITEIAAGPQPTRGAVEDHRAALATASREQGQAVRFVLQGMDSAAASPPDRPQSAAQYADEALSALAPGLPPADPVATVTQREVIPRDPAPEPRVILDT